MRSWSGLGRSGEELRGQIVPIDTWTDCATGGTVDMGTKEVWGGSTEESNRGREMEDRAMVGWLSCGSGRRPTDGINAGGGGMREGSHSIHTDILYSTVQYVAVKVRRTVKEGEEAKGENGRMPGTLVDIGRKVPPKLLNF